MKSRVWQLKTLHSLSQLERSIAILPTKGFAMKPLKGCPQRSIGSIIEITALKRVYQGQILRSHPTMTV